MAITASDFEASSHFICREGVLLDPKRFVPPDISIISGTQCPPIKGGSNHSIPRTFGLRVAFSALVFTLHTLALKLSKIKASVLTDILYNLSNGQELRIGAMTHWKWINLNAGSSFSENRNAKSLGFSFNYRRWKINCGIYFHENSILGTPIFIDICHYL